MDAIFIVEQALNGFQFGVMLFLMAAGLTLIFGIMSLINLAHGSLYMMGAYFAAALLDRTDSFLLSLFGALAGVIALGALLEIIAYRRLYNRQHLDQVLATFGLILFFNEIARIIWGNEPQYMTEPDWLSGQVEFIPGIPYPVYRLAIIIVGLLVALGLYILIRFTRTGMLIRAGASNRTMVEALGVNIRALYTLLFAVGAALAALAGIMMAPILTVQVGMGEPILILAFVVIVIGGIGSVHGALVAALLVGWVDTFGRVILPQLMGDTTGAAAASMIIYILMATVLIWRPQGLLPVSNV